MTTKAYPVYVQSLRRESTAAQAELAAIKAGLDRLSAHLCSDKFSGAGNQWISTTDLHAWLAEIRSDAMCAA